MRGLGSLEGRNIVVTGAAQGIGAALVDKAISLGARVLAVDLNGEPLAALKDRHGAEVLTRSATLPTTSSCGPRSTSPSNSSVLCMAWPTTPESSAPR